MVNDLIYMYFHGRKRNKNKIPGINWGGGICNQDLSKNSQGGDDVVEVLSNLINVKP